MALIDFATARAQRHTDAILDDLDGLRRDLHLALEAVPAGPIRAQLEAVADLAARLDDVAVRYLGGVIVAGGDLDLRLKEIHNATRPKRPAPVQLELMEA